MGAQLNGKPIHGFRVEQRVDFVHEAYVSLSIDGETARIRLLVSAEGGVDVEAHAADEGGALTALARTGEFGRRGGGAVRRTALVRFATL